MGPDSGAYLLVLRVARNAWIEAGKLGRHRVQAGLYVYAGSARRALQQRVARHRRLADNKCGNRHWHIDGVLLHRYTRLLHGIPIGGGDECRLAQALAATPGCEVPIAGFGATDCRNHCPSHFLRVSEQGLSQLLNDATTGTLCGPYARINPKVS